ncbi:hypothetical protein AB0C51_13130 [Streptomyces pathocidini]|uniref:hypothetical protein n=1 Tax=Streptomyces pathocidini TaxID=1650571 RepID=UPI0033E65DA0
MSFSIAQYEALMEKLDSGIRELSAKLGEVGPATRSAAGRWYVPDEIGDALVWAGRELVEIGSWVLKKIQELLEGAAAPVLMFKYAWEWQEDVRSPASLVAGEVHSDVLKAARSWQGTAADAYATAVKTQTTAVTQIETSADKIATSLGLCAVAGFAFYVALGAILYKFIAATIAAITAAGTGVFSWAGVVLIVEECGVNSALIIAAVTALSAALGAQAQQIATIQGEAGDNSAFPGGHWPAGTA